MKPVGCQTCSLFRVVVLFSRAWGKSSHTIVPQKLTNKNKNRYSNSTRTSNYTKIEMRHVVSD